MLLLAYSRKRHELETYSGLYFNDSLSPINEIGEFLQLLDFELGMLQGQISQINEPKYDKLLIQDKLFPSYLWVLVIKKDPDILSIKWSFLMKEFKELATYR